MSKHMRHICLFLLFVCIPQMYAQIVQPVTWFAEEAGDSVRLSAAIDTGWHMTLISVGDSSVGAEYEHSCVLTLPFDGSAPVSVRYNACDDSQCTAPEIFTYPSSSVAATPALDAEAAPDVAPSLLSDSSDSASDSASLWWIFLMGFLGGLLAIFTPCVWPVIPMTVSFFLKRGGGLRSALFYGLSIVLIYVGLGLLVTVLFGASALNALSTNAVLNLFFFVLLVVFSLSFFGLFDITLPASWSTRIDSRARSASGFLSIVLMAFTLVIVSFSCTGPIIGTLLVEAAGNSLLAPAVGMLGFALALAMPFSVFALFPDVMQRLPRSGDWMTSFKVTLAFLELALSLKFLSVADMAYGWNVLPRRLFVFLWICCFAGLAAYLFVRLWRSRKERKSVSLTLLGLLVALLSAAFAFYLVPGLFGAPVRLIAAFAPPLPAQGQAVFYDYEQGMDYARRHNKPVLLQFSGYGCVNCRKMEAYVLDNDSVKAALSDYVLITLYVDSRQDENGNGIQDGVEYSALQRDFFRSNSQPFFVRLDPASPAPSSPIFPFSSTSAHVSPDFVPSDPFYFSASPSEFLLWLRD